MLSTTVRLTRAAQRSLIGVCKQQPKMLYTTQTPGGVGSSEAWRDFGRRHIAAGVGRLSELVLTDGAGSWVSDVEGNKYLDFTSGIGVVNTGHCHPTVVEAVVKQAKRLSHGQVNVVFHEPMLRLTSRLLQVMPSPDLDTVFYANSGAEAVEGAIKLARHATGKPNIIVFQGSYHGRTIGTMSLTTSKTIYKAGFGPLMPGVFVAPFPYAKQLPRGTKDMNAYCLEQVELLLKQQTDPRETAAVLLEPILGEGGYVVPDKEFMQGLKAICEKHELLFIADEIQAGFGRTGKMFAVEHFDVVPDILVIAKGLASGYPLSGIVSRKELMDKQPPGCMGGTYTGNAVACAAAEATLQVFEDENLLERATRSGEMMRARLSEMQSDSGLIQEVRGLGLMNAIEFDSNKVKPGAAGRVSQHCLQHGMLVLPCSAFDTLRFIPPLNVSENELHLGMTLLESAINAVAKE
mmetsp:Transcript_14644/g.43983  ORF Transcript_14644/g.43983 Transcript_14644/m.43983 type:complete len:463 (+) Transcript_14644:2189-3577(+)|eukprot:CAMPEP_0174241828 /NCGR_PEP_ID=MMETSP0417-20130205/25070_1 /TAXON_ID=242541 /ORGANISM="Mayorella sp, Strain BSH-02190019" /LENGTH=462 /DNA_ID=CAMNT_0015321135 /DNA_START=54 /DNA_END=1442 /DNA_ORIENTATION=-